MSTIKIFTGPTNSGKTTRLMLWAASQKNIDGIFQPLIEGKRCIYHMGSRTLKLLESVDSSAETSIVKVGKYNFNNYVFDWAKDILKKIIIEKLDWLIIDEVGSLELDGKGLEPVISEIINYKKFDGNIVFVVRKSLIKKFIDRFKLGNYYEIFEL